MSAYRTETTWLRDLRPALAVVGLRFRPVAGDEALRMGLQLKK
jgi:hypothetical protein